jgi:F-type H+-transporting ATPase subunit epsilon
MPDLTLEIATPAKLLVNETVSQVEIPGKDGYFGVLPGAAPLISELAEGKVTYSGASGSHTIVIKGGFAEVLNDKVKILADSAE